MGNSAPFATAEAALAAGKTQEEIDAYIASQKTTEAAPAPAPAATTDADATAADPNADRELIIMIAFNIREGQREAWEAFTQEEDGLKATLAYDGCLSVTSVDNPATPNFATYLVGFTSKAAQGKYGKYRQESGWTAKAKA